MKILHVVGARPQLMKLHPLLKSLDRTEIISKVLHTGQHFDTNMSDIFFDEMCIKNPDYHLNVRSSMVSKMLDKITDILIKDNFDTVFVYGDTNSTVAGALAGRQLGLKVIHYESGVRNLDPSMPEEINRIIVDRISDILLCVSDECLTNLQNETCWYDAKLYKTGDLMYDSFLEFMPNKINENQISDNSIQKVISSNEKYIYVTVHRASNTDNRDNLKDILSSLCTINKDIKVIFPVHPRTREAMDKYSLSVDFELFNPIGYTESLSLIQNCDFVITDSGGVVRESYWADKPSILLLKNPLWPELVDLDACINCSPEYSLIMNSYEKISSLNPKFNSGVYGDGNSAKIIRDLLQKK